MAIIAWPWESMTFKIVLLQDEKDYSSRPFGLVFHLSSCILEDGSLFCFVRNIHKSNNYRYALGNLCLEINLKVTKEINLGNNCFCHADGS